MVNYQAYWLEQQRLRNAKQDPIGSIDKLYKTAQKVAPHTP